MAYGIRLDAGGGATPDLTDPSNQTNPLAGGVPSSGGGGGSSRTHQVYMGQSSLPKFVHYGPGGVPEVRKGAKKDNVATYTDPSDTWYSMSDKEREAWATYAVTIGLVSSDDAHDYTVLRDKWSDAVKEASDWYEQGKKKITPFQAAQLLASHTLSLSVAKQAKAQDKAAEAKRQAMMPQRSVTVNLTDPETARAIVASAMQQYLGRDPSDEQVSAFTHTLQAAERSNPQITNTTFTEDKNGNPVPHTTTSGGFGADAANELVKNQVMSLPDYGAYQAGTTVMSWLEQALGSPVGN
jgi:hypothetical protein